MSSSSAAVPAADQSGTAVVPVETVEELDEDTVLQLVRAMRPVGVSIGVGGVAPVVLGLGLLRLAATGLFDVPAIALAAGLAVAVGAPFAILYGQRRAFVAECRSLGISTKVAKKLYWRFVRGDFRIEMRLRATRDELDRGVARRLLEP